MQHIGAHAVAKAHGVSKAIFAVLGRVAVYIYLVIVPDAGGGPGLNIALKRRGHQRDLRSGRRVDRDGRPANVYDIF